MLDQGILKDILTKLPATEDGVLNLLSNETKDLSGAVLTNICQRAYKLAIRESIKEKKQRAGQTTMDIDEPATLLKIRRHHFEKAINLARHLVNEDDISK
jgi:transitional endoplasmic reticulum ATPase